MKIIIPPLYESLTNKVDPFMEDSFGRKKFAQNLTMLFKNISDGLVLTIDSDWGDGKTTFIHLWKESLKKEQNFIPVYYDAFKNDFSSDAFLSIAALIHNALNKHLKENGIDVKNSAQLKHLKESAKELTKELIKMTSSLVISSLTGNMLPKLGENWLSKVFNKIFIDTFEINVDEKFKAHHDAKKAIDNYQSSLKEILNFDTNSNNKKIVFFVDELDRCRPDFAVQVIEKIKHLFNIENVFFVLSINRQQLLSTIASVYGVSPEDSSVYLQKFVHIETHLPPMHGVNTDSNETIIYNHLIKLCHKMEIQMYFDTEENIIAQLAQLMSIKLLSLNPRGMERVLTMIAIAMGSIDKSMFEPLRKPIVVMAAIKIAEPAIYNDVKSGTFRDSWPNRGLWEWLKKYFNNEAIEKANNVFEVPTVSNACEVLDIYQIPGPLDNKKESDL